MEDHEKTWRELVAGASAGRQAVDERLQLIELSAIFARLPDPVIVFDLAGIPTRANPAALSACGSSGGRGLDCIRDHLTFRHLNGVPATPNELPWSRALRDEDVVDERYIFASAEGRERIIQASAWPWRVGGQTRGAIATWHDITKHERLLLDVSSQRRLFQTVIDNVPAGIAVVRGPDFVFELINPAYQAIAPGKSILGRTVEEVWPEFSAQVLPFLKRALESGMPQHVADMLLSLRRAPDKPLEHGYFSVTYVPMSTPDGWSDAVLVLVVETTEQVKARVEAEGFERQKDQFIQVAAHELKTPIAIMKGYAQALLRRTGDISPEHRKMLESINTGADRITRIVGDLLDISRLQTGHLELSLERLDLSMLVEQVVVRTGLTATKHQVRLLRSEPLVVEGDPDRLGQVLTNLIDNAMRYSPRGGNVDVEVVHAAGEAVVSVKDDGVGIPLAKQAHMFERFYRAHTHTPYDYGGMGVGLYISKEIVARHGGRIWFQSEAGEGSTFYFGLPLWGERQRA